MFEVCSRLVGIISIFFMFNMYATTTELEAIITRQNKIVVFFGDLHKKRPEEQGQLNCLIDCLKRHTAEGESFHLLVEQASNLNKSLCKSKYEILYRLDEFIQNASFLHNHIKYQNIEVRHVSGPAKDILKSEKPQVFDRFYQYPIDDKIIFGEITFHDILNEFDQLQLFLSEYYQKSGDKRLENIFSNHMRNIRFSYKEFKNYVDTMSLKNIKVLDYAKQGCLKQNFILSKNIYDMFMPLFDLHLLQNILISDYDKVLVVAGCNHTQNVIQNMVYDLNASSIYHTIQEKEDMPVTEFQIKNAFFAKPKTSLTYANIFSCMTLFVMVYCLLSSLVTI